MSICAKGLAACLIINSIIFTLEPTFNYFSHGSYTTLNFNLKKNLFKEETVSIDRKIVLYYSTEVT